MFSLCLADAQWASSCDSPLQMTLQYSQWNDPTDATAMSNSDVAVVPPDDLWREGQADLAGCGAATTLFGPTDNFDVEDDDAGLAAAAAEVEEEGLMHALATSSRQRTVKLQ